MSETTEPVEPQPPFDAEAVFRDLARRLNVRALRDEPLAGHTTMRVGGPADLFVTARNIVELRAIVRFARARAIPHLVIGRGSNVVFSDAGFRGLVIRSRAEGFSFEGETLRAEAGLPMAKAATEAAKLGLAGIEYGIAIPGTVGGAVWGNAGAHGSETAEILESVLVLEADGGERRFEAAELGMTYRDSRFKHPEGAGDLILEARFRLRPDSPEAVKARIDEHRSWRRDHQPLGQASAGSVFRNPVGEAAAGRSAGALIDAAGLKGHSVGGATISPKHANFIVTREGATASDVRSLADFARAEVLRRDGIRLEYEIIFVGDWSDHSGDRNDDPGSKPGERPEEGQA